MLVDDAHNLHGYAAVADFVRFCHEGLRIGVISGPGHRRDEDLVALGTIAGRVLDWGLDYLGDYLSKITTGGDGL